MFRNEFGLLAETVMNDSSQNIKYYVDNYLLMLFLPDDRGLPVMMMLCQLDEDDPEFENNMELACLPY